VKLIVLNRTLHYWGAALIALPLLFVISTGLLLQLKKNSEWIQPKENRGTGKVPVVNFDQIFEAVKQAPGLNVTSWDQIDRLDVRPDKGMVKIRMRDNHEVQVDLGTGKLLQVAFRRSDIIETIHDGSIVGNWMKLGIILPSGFILLFLWLSGIWMWVHPLLNRRKVRLRKAARPWPLDQGSGSH
jgi:uncharacterized iron-regulated membrane protein